MMRSRQRRAITIGLACALGTAFAAAAELASPLAPEESLRHFQLDAGLAIELVACEPHVIDPIAIRFDEDGRLWVVEMRDYPHGPPAGQPPLSTIRVLDDADGDGRYERATVFADKLLFPTGLQPWQGGVIVTLAGEVAYLKDVDGDGRADRRETWYRGFTAENPQLRANHPRFGLDNRVYIANGLRGGAIVDARRPQAEPLSISGRDFAFDPHSGRCAAVSGNGQFGLAFDDWGRRFVCNNREPLNHVVLENDHLARNPFLAVPAVVNQAAAAGEASHVFPLTRAWTTSNLHAGQFTAACGVEIYRGDALDRAYRGNAFICEPTASLVHRELLAPVGATFTAKPAQAGREFLASPDPWFRPVNLELGPDGALYVVDMYRAVIEHPEFMPSELQHRPDLRRGDDRGRIYRIVPAGARKRSQRPQLSRASSAELAGLCEHPNAWWRETAARLLYERQDAAAQPHLARLATEAREPVSRSCALWALAGLESLSSELIERASRDPSPRVREQAVALAEPALAENEALRTAVVRLAADPDPRVRFLVALAIGGIDNPAALARIAQLDAGDVWTRRAVATARPEHSAPLLLAVLDAARKSRRDASGQDDLVYELAQIVGARHDLGDLRRVLSAVCHGPPDVRLNETAMLGVAEGLARRGSSLADTIAKLADGQLARSLGNTYDRAAAAALDDSLPEDIRVGKLKLLRHARGDHVVDACQQLVEQGASQALRTEAVAVLAHQPGERIAAPLVNAYPSQTPSVRRAILDALVVDPAAANALLDAVETKRIVRAEFNAAHENRLRQHPDAATQARARRLLVTVPPAERRAVLADYQKSLRLAADPRAGQALFRQHCATCHHIAGIGVDVAPDISDSRVKTPEQLLTDILNPNQAIDNNYASYTIATTDGSVHTGIIAAETPASVTLRQPENKTVSLLRADIESIASSGLSLMPDGFERHLSYQQMADLIAFIKNWRYLDQAVPVTIAPGGNE